MSVNPALDNNPLMVPVSAHIDYAAITPAHIAPAIDALLENARQAVEQAASPALPATWEAVVLPLELASEQLWRAWSVVGHLNSVVNTPELRAAYNEMLPKVSEFSTWVGLHEGLYKQYLRLQHAGGWSPARLRVLELALRDFRLSGVALEGEARERYARNAEQQAQVSQKFSENVLDAIDAWALYVEDEAQLDGLPDDVRQAARNAAQEEGKTGWKLTLKMPCYLPVMQYARDRSLRETLYRGYATVASENGDARFDNGPQIEQLLALRAEEAQLLGYTDFATLRLETRMADSAEQVTEFLRTLAQRARPYAESDLAALQAFARAELALDPLAPWDVPFAAERLREQRYAYSDDTVKRYFTLPRVLEGLFGVANSLFGVKLTPAELPGWHPDVRSFAVTQADGKILGHLHMDLYARAGKQGGAWVDGERNRRLSETGVQTPVAYLICNFASPQDGRPALLTHDDVITLFHESGHALHALLSEVDEPALSAFSAVEWDAIELPSQFMENFCWEWEVVQGLSAHVETGEPLPRELFDKLLAARNFQGGMQMLRQIEFSLFDMLLHQQVRPMVMAEVLTVLDKVRQEVAVLYPPAWHRFPNSFSHLFAGGYGAGYYSYKWAEVLSADAYAAFEEAAQAGNGSTLDAATGARFRKEILAVGGERPAAESFRAFRARDASMDALLRHSGMDGQP
ncbi:M3 family metallopeptidase [Kerstersia similis]|uniref:M3 family metallopeptidase n=1 Tax=Kerstersia similis TaxID=206505 RepID=UPI0039EE4D6E